MELEKSDGFLTCMQACDTISLMCGMDYNSLIANSKEFTDACAVILKTKLSDVPESHVIFVTRMKSAVVEFLGIEGIYENLNSSAGAKVFNL